MIGQLKAFESTQVSEEEILLSQRYTRAVASGHSREIDLHEPESPTPLSFEQHQILLQAATNPEMPIGNRSFTLGKYGSFDVRLFAVAFNEILKRHKILRTHLDIQRSEWVQVVLPNLQVGFDLLDLSMLSSSQREAEAQRLATEDALLPFDLSIGPLFRVRVLRMGAADHRVQITIHQLLIDSFSMHGIFASELAAVYAALERGEKPTVAKAELQYGDYAVWQQSQTDRPEHREFWRSQLAGEIPLLRLPSDRPRPAVVTRRGATEYFDLPEDLMQSIRGLAGAHDASVYAVLLAAFHTMLFRYTGQQDVLVGGIADGRRRPDLLSVIGCFSDTFLVRSFPSADQTFSGFLTSVRDTALAATDAAQMPFSRIVQMAGRNADASQGPQLQAVLGFQSNTTLLPGGWHLSRTKVNSAATEFELHVEVEESASEERASKVEARIAYSTDLFDAATIRRMASHWMTLLEGAATDPQLTLGELPLLSAEERRQMLVLWNQTEAPVPQKLLHDTVAEVATLNPETIAVEFEGESCTYRQLANDFSRIAAHLRAKGSRRGEIVAVCLTRSQHLPAALLGVLGTGAAYLPLDPAAPFARKQLCLDDATPVILLTQQSLLKDLPPTNAMVVLLEDCLSQQVPSNFMQEPIGFDDAAYVIHTSGSTGRPKAVEIPHRALINFLESMRLKPGFASTDTLLAVTTLSFDIAGLELFLPLTVGGRAVVASREVAQDPYLLAAAIEQCSCNVLQATPATWRALLDSGWKGRSGLRAFCGGEPLTPTLARRLLAQKLELWNLYGPTETTVWSTLQQITCADQPISVGRPIANTTIYILDARQQPVPIGVPGDLYIGGVGLANGYRNQPQLTAEKFRTPGIAGGERLYFTGDTAFYRADGTIEVGGRTDNQVKIRGFRVELEEVEAAMVAHPGIASAVAMAWPDASGGHQLCGYIVGRGENAPATGELRQFLGSRLPHYMVPSAIVTLDALPITLNGKMDRKALKPPTSVPGSLVLLPSDGGATVRNPAITPEERRLAAIWADLLCMDVVSLDDNFFDLGGHSLLVARLQSRIHLEFGVKVPMASLFHATTVPQQIELLHECERGTSHPGIIPFQSYGAGPRLFWIQPPTNIGRVAAAMGNQSFFGVTMTLAEVATLGPDPSLEDLARLYADAITQFQPKGPYFLCGFCAGGVLAYAVAAQLSATGHELGLLVVLDVGNPVFFRRLGSPKTELNKIWFYLRRTGRKGGLKTFVAHLRFRLRQILRLSEISATEMSLVENSIVDAIGRYQPPAYSGDVVLMCADERPSSVDYYPGWKTVVRGTLTSVDISGHHDDLVSPINIPSIASALTACLASSQAEYSVAS